MISGQDLPLHTQNEIHCFFEKIKPDTNFIGYAQGESNERSLRERMRFYVPFTKHYRCRSAMLSVLCDNMRDAIVKLQRKTGFIKRVPPLEYKKGCEWASMTDSFVRYLLAHETEILRIYRGTPCCDEIYKQTAAWNSCFRATLYNIEDEYEGCMREIDWGRGNPYTYCFGDLENLQKSSRIFARKFDSEIDKDIIDAICNSILSGEANLK